MVFSTPLISEVFAFCGNRIMYFKYMFNSFSLSIGLVAPLERGGSSTCSILKEDKNSTRKGVKKIVR
jgi:hypothetical protein